VRACVRACVCVTYKMAAKISWYRYVTVTLCIGLTQQYFCMRARWWKTNALTFSTTHCSHCSCIPLGRSDASDELLQFLDLFSRWRLSAILEFRVEFFLTAMRFRDTFHVIRLNRVEIGRPVAEMLQFFAFFK